MGDYRFSQGRSVRGCRLRAVWAKGVCQRCGPGALNVESRSIDLNLSELISLETAKPRAATVGGGIDRPIGPGPRCSHRQNACDSKRPCEDMSNRAALPQYLVLYITFSK